MACGPFLDLGTTIVRRFRGQAAPPERPAAEADGAADRIDGRARSGAQPSPTAILFDVDLAEVSKIVDDALPFEPAAAGREAVDQLLAQDKG
jgi:hypothetical protein